MLRIEVEPSWLGIASANHSALADSFSALDGDVAGTGGSAVSAAGDPALGHGIAAATQQFGAGIRSLDAEMRGLSAGLAAAARAYIEVDDSHIAGAGSVGVWTKADSVTLFDDFAFGPK